jgi:hypothetical protein
MPADEEPKVGAERSRARTVERHFYKLPYASTNWIRFEGSPCRVRADGLSVPCRDSPSSLVESGRGPFDTTVDQRRRGQANTNQGRRQFVTRNSQAVVREALGCVYLR